MNRSKRLGTEEEVRLVKRYREIYSDHPGIKVEDDIDRAANCKRSWDLIVPPLGFPIEVKRRLKSVISVPEWVRIIRSLGFEKWVLHVSAGDLRKPESLGRIVVIPEKLYFDLLKGQVF